MNDSLVTIIGSSYFEPISVLLEKLAVYDRNSENEVQAGYYVNGYASSICLLAVVCLESYVMRVRYINKASQTQIDKVSVPAYLKSLYSDFPFEDELYEIHILRDILAHNHLWEVSFSWDDEKDMILHTASRWSSGDKKYKNYVDVQNHVTRNLGLNVNPVKVGTSDVEKVLHTMWKVLLFLEGKNRNQCYVSHLSVRHKGKVKKFGEVIGLSETCI